MVMSSDMRLIAAALVAIVWAAASPQPPVASDRGPYDASPNHLWNRVHEALHVRVAPNGERFGADAADPLLWRETTHLLTAPSHARVLTLLDEFLSTHGERLIKDPLKRAVFQRDLWAVFDWAVARTDVEPAARLALAQRLVRIMRRVALRRAALEALPDTYAAAAASGAFSDWTDVAQPQGVLPRDLLTPSGPWVSLAGLEPMAPRHASELTRSSFVVFWRLPGGAAETTAYLRTLWNHPQPFVQDRAFRVEQDGEMRAALSPSLPSPPNGSRFVLLRRMLLVDTEGLIFPSTIVESVQLRVLPGAQGFAELRLSRAALFAGRAGGLRAVAREEQGFITFSAHGHDLFERTPAVPFRLGRVVEGCVNCHHQLGAEAPLTTVLSLPQVLKPATLVDSRHERWARWFTSDTIAATAKARAYDWGVFSTLWQTLPRQAGPRAAPE